MQTVFPWLFTVDELDGVEERNLLNHLTQKMIIHEFLQFKTYQKRRNQV